MILRSLPLRVLAVGFIVLALPLLIDSFIFFQHAYNTSIEYAKETLKETANSRSFAISELDPINPIVVDELTVLLNLENAEPDFKYLNEKLALAKTINLDLEISLLEEGKDGAYKAVASSNLDLINSVYTSPFVLQRFLEHDGKGNFIRFRYSELMQKYVPFITVAKLIRPKDLKQSNKILIISFPIQEIISPMIAETQERDLLINFAVMTKDKIIFIATDPSLIGQHFLPVGMERVSELELLKPLGDIHFANKPLPTILSGTSPFFEFIFQDQVQIAYAVKIPKVDLYFLAYTTKENLFSNSIKHFLLVYTVYGLIFVIGGGISYWLSTWISRPLMQLCNAMERVGKGDLKVRFKEEPLGFEINLLGIIFNQTLDTLFENIHKAENERVLKETLRKELELGQEAQLSLLPQKVIKPPGVEFEATYLSTKEVGGDFFDIFLKDNNHLGLVMADASGKGISACLYALSVRSLLRTYMTLHNDVGIILSNTNNMFLKDTGDSGMFVTVLMGIYDIEKKILSYYSCGHVPGIVRRADGQLVVLSHTGMALGLKESIPFKADTLQLYSGDLILLYTDGLIDVVNEKHQHFTEKRLRNFLQQRKLETPQEVIEGLKEEVKSFTQGIAQDEEIAILCVKVL